MSTKSKTPLSASERSGPRPPVAYLTFEEFTKLPASAKPDAHKDAPDDVRVRHGLTPAKPLPCPFCGKLPRANFHPAEKGEHDAFYTLTCHRKTNLCPAMPTAMGDTEAEALVNWNTRVTDKQLDAALAACRQIRFAVKNAARFKGEYNLGDILTADKLAGEALGKKGRK